MCLCLSGGQRRGWLEIASRQKAQIDSDGDHMRPVTRTQLKSHCVKMSLDSPVRDTTLLGYLFRGIAERDTFQNLKLASRQCWHALDHVHVCPM